MRDLEQKLLQFSTSLCYKLGDKDDDDDDDNPHETVRFKGNNPYEEPRTMPGTCVRIHSI